MRSTAALLVLLLVSCQTDLGGLKPAPALALRDIDAFVARTLRTIPEVTSVGLALVHDGQRYARGYGLANVEKNIPATADTGYYIGSTTKGFTGLTAAILAGRGVIDLDAPITKYLPELRFTNGVDASAVTLRRLMSHSAAISNDAITFRTAFSGEHTPAKLIEVLGGTTTRKAGFEYDNLGYVVAGLVMQRVTGKPWQQLHDELVFTPLGMTRSTGYMSEAVREAMAEPYDRDSQGRMHVISFRKNDQMMHAAGGTVMTAEDLSRWLQAGLTKGRVGGRQVIPAAAFEQTQRAQATLEKPHALLGGTTYGFGWYEGRLAEQPVLYHGGGFEGWRSLFTLMPSKELAVGVMTNTGIGNRAALLITNYAYARLLGQANIDADYAEKLSQLRKDIDNTTTRIVEEATKRAARKSQLSRESSAYVGRYENPLYGVITVRERDGRLFASIGGLNSVVEPYTEPETARVELIPGSGEVVRFSPSTGRPSTLTLGEDVFTRIE